MAEPASSGRDQIATHAAWLTLGTLASRILGMAREAMIAATFEIGATDAFFVAWRVPNAMRAMLAEGAARYVFFPALGQALTADSTRLATDDDAARARLRATLGDIRGSGALVLGLCTIAGIVFARPLFALMSGGFSGDSARFELGTSLLRVLFPYLFFMGWFAIGNSALQILKIVRPGAFAPVMLNVAFLVIPFPLMPLLASRGYAAIYALAIAALVGGVLQLVWLMPALRRERLVSRPTLRWNATTRQLASNFVAQIYGQAVYQINVVLAGRFLSSLPRGSASYFNYAQRLADIPQGLFAVALSGAAAISMQTDASRGDLDAVARKYETSLRMAAVVALPMAVILGVYAEAIVPLIYSYGRFRSLGPSGVLEVAESLRFQCVGIGLLAFVHQTTAVFGSLQRRRTVVGAATASLGTFSLVGHFGAARFGHAGVAMAMAASAAVQLATLLFLVRRAIPVRFSDTGPTIARVLAACGASALAARALVLFAPVTQPTLPNRIFAVLGGCFVLSVYVFVAWWTGCEEIQQLVAKVRRTLGRQS